MVGLARFLWQHYWPDHSSGAHCIWGATVNCRTIPRGGENPYAAHPGFDAQECILQYTVTPAQYSSSHHGFGCHWTGGHCLPGDACKHRVKNEQERLADGVSLIAR